MARRKQLSGGAKLKIAGKHAILLGLDNPIHAVLSEAAALEMRPVTQFVTYHALAAAKIVISQLGRTANTARWPAE